MRLARDGTGYVLIRDRDGLRVPLTEQEVCDLSETLDHATAVIKRERLQEMVRAYQEVAA